MKKNRLTFIGLVVFILFGLLIFRLFNITVINGEYYRDQADNSRRKQINDKAARGNIYDRNGNILAGNVPIYNLNVYLDRFRSVSNEEKNSTLLDLVHILEEDGVSYLDDFLLGMYKYKYKSDIDYFKNPLSPISKMVEIVKDEKLVSDIIETRIEIGEGNEYFYYPINRILDYLSERGKEVPIVVETGSNIRLSFEENDRYKKMLEDQLIKPGQNAKDFLISYIKDDNSLLYYLLDHPLTRKLVYELTVSKNIDTGVELTEITFNSDLDYIENKASLNRLSDKVTLTSDVKSDFINLVKDNSLDSLLTMVYINDDKEPVVPAELLINQLNSSGVKTDISYKINDDNSSVSLEYVNEKNVQDKPIDTLIRLAKDNNLLDKFIVNEDIIYLAEKSLFDKNIYPKIIKSNWIYAFEKDKQDLLDDSRIKRYGINQESSAEDLLRAYMQRHELEDYSLYEAFGIISVYNKINSKGYKAYEPVTLAKNISERTLAEVEERMPKTLGFEIVVQPKRFYPYGSSLSHTLGYMGRISDQYEIREYIEHRKYDGDDVIGKTGLEESFEDTLRGTNGHTIVYTDIYGNTTDTIEELAPVPGNNLYTTIDINLQREVENILKDALEAKANGTVYKGFTGDYYFKQVPDIETAAAVVTNVKTGEVLASVSYPGYDPNLFVNGISNNDWEQLTKNKDTGVYSAKPLMNLVTQGAMPPGSTFKTVTSLAALENGMDPEQKITCMGFIDIGNTRFNCLIYSLTGQTHGPINLYDALKHSCNYYYYALGLGENPKVEGELDFKVTLEDVEETVDKLGLNKLTGLEINIPQESIGYSPSLYGKQRLIRGMLRNYLDANIDKYLKNPEPINEDEKLKDIYEILSWVEIGPDLSRNEVIEKLDQMGYKAEEPLEDEYVGLADQIKYSYLNQAVWTQSDSLNMVIGQGQNAYTPIQLNVLASTIANEGKRVSPTLVKKISNFDNTKDIYIKEKEETIVDVAPDSFKAVKEGMRRASTTLRAHLNLPITTASKTGTAESGSINPKTGDFYAPFGWEISFAPFEDPEIAVTVVMIQGRESIDSATLNSDIIYAYYKHVKKDPRFTNERLESPVDEEESTVQEEDIIEQEEQSAEEDVIEEEIVGD
ncbi:MAG: penicillin-binding transpeptidase domain-containing protein [Tissierellia bacterium]|nr:penicillin-binding transpeptidase domain-containing protein [Tissierellia bacterium]